MINKTLTINEESIKNELSKYKDKPYKSIFEYIWNSFDAGATKVSINFELPEKEFGYISNFYITDNGKGWNFEENNTETFLSSNKSKKNNKKKSLPKGKLGRGRYVFIWFCDKLQIISDQKILTLQGNTKFSINNSLETTSGTIIKFINVKEKLSNAIKNISLLEKQLVLEYCWFLKENPSFEITINDKKVNFQKNIKKEKTYSNNEFSDNVREYLDDSFKVTAVLWTERPNEFSKFYFLDANTKKEIFTRHTSLNKKKDEYWHSVYIESNLFTEEDQLSVKDTLPLLEIDNVEIKEAKKNIINEIRTKLIELRKPILVQKSEHIVSALKVQKILPRLEDFGIYDEESYNDLLKQVYVIAPSLFIGKSKEESSFICATFAGLLSSQDNLLIKIILEQMQELTENEKQDLENILKRTTLSNMVRTIKEIDIRLQVISDLSDLLFEFKKETLEVKHLQQVLNVNPWIFGEKYRLFRDTEGALKKTLFDFAKEILNIKNPIIETESRKEVDLLLVKSLSESEIEQRNIVIEIKRPSIKLGKKEYDQIEAYAIEIKKESICNADNMIWEFYLIGNDYNDYIADKIDEMKTYGQKSKGLISHQKNGQIKIYVRKWSDILYVELEHKMKYLKDQLKIKSQPVKNVSPENITKKYLTS